MAYDKGNEKDYRTTEGYKKLQEHYQELISKGWTFESNCFNSDTGEAGLNARVSRLKSRGLEVFVGDITFLPGGTESKSAVPIFTKSSSS